jgi:hypothetical protein
MATQPLLWKEVLRAWMWIERTLKLCLCWTYVKSLFLSFLSFL